MAVSQQPAFDGVLRVSAGMFSMTNQCILHLTNVITERLDAQFQQLRNNRVTLFYWVSIIHSLSNYIKALLTSSTHRLRKSCLAKVILHAGSIHRDQNAFC